MPRIKYSGLEDIELQEEATLGLECGNGQMDLASHFQNDVKENQTIWMVFEMSCLFQAIGLRGGFGMISTKVTKFPLLANAGTFFDKFQILLLLGRV